MLGSSSSLIMPTSRSRLLSVYWCRRMQQCSQLERPNKSSEPLFDNLYNTRRSYFTNGQITKRDDPYETLGLEWGDGATTAEIRQAFRNKAKALHPDVVDKSKMPIEQAQQEFQRLVKAYESLLKNVQADADNDSIEEWRLALWRQSDRIALDRTDVAGAFRKRPAPPAQTESRRAYGRELGHPSGKGTSWSRGEYLSDGKTNSSTSSKLRSSSVGRGQSKWVQSSKNKAYKEWRPH